MAVKAGPRELQIPEERRLALWGRAERMRIGVEHARATREALADQRSRHASGGSV